LAIATASVADARVSIIPAEPLVAAQLLMPAVAGPLVAARIPARSAASLTEVMRGHFPLAAGRASAGVLMVASAEAPMVEEVTDENDARTTAKSIEGA
jgi:hypothetical protein